MSQSTVRTVLRAAPWLVLGAVLVACGARTPRGGSDPQLAQQALIAFFEDLHAGRYEQAATAYGGTYETMIDHNPEHDPVDFPGLLRNACTINGAQCLPVRSATALQPGGPEEYRFEVEFALEDGSAFVLGPCCGGSEADFPPTSTFTYSVIKGADGRFQVMGMPVYAP